MEKAGWKGKEGWGASSVCCWPLPPFLWWRE